MYNENFNWAKACISVMVKIYNKLVRDKIPEITRANGGAPIVRVLTADEFRVALQKKLREEANEVFMESAPEDILAELADCLEVIETLTKELGFSLEALHAQKELKRQQKGGFEKKLFLEKVEEKDVV